MTLTRNQRIEQALFRGHTLTLDNPAYCDAVRTTTDLLVRTDHAGDDLTARALEMKHGSASACVIAREAGVAAGLTEFAFLMRARGVKIAFQKQDGDAVKPGDTLLRADGEELKLLSLERVGLNLLQRMSGIATASRCLQQRAGRRSPATRIVGTRKTPWGLLDKRALHLGNGGTHRLGLGDAIVIKNNHLALIASREQDAVELAIEKAWKSRAESAFIEIEVRGADAARISARTFRRLQQQASEQYPCLLMLDNMTPDELGAIVDLLRGEDLWDHTLIEASGGISETNLEAYSLNGVDAISIGALTHSARALDICQRIS
ncbi:MAG TPA: carboxylating nicotinate-nucleotide diphosphorylase [Candidatus Cybelea sp.]|jgi:nicotinate-nucleotide pyrophosphorylase (carboxylating)|nr:carboxylating nicotinate-nucleotide diphosphorylase [Candidatus Cybelea sp.]